MRPAPRWRVRATSAPSTFTESAFSRLRCLAPSHFPVFRWYRQRVVPQLVIVAWTDGNGARRGKARPRAPEVAPARAPGCYLLPVMTAHPRARTRMVVGDGIDTGTGNEGAPTGPAAAMRTGRGPGAVSDDVTSISLKCRK